jgi:hypothetical protein
VADMAAEDKIFSTITPKNSTAPNAFRVDYFAKNDINQAKIKQASLESKNRP